MDTKDRQETVKVSVKVRVGDQEFVWACSCMHAGEDIELTVDARDPFTGKLSPQKIIVDVAYWEPSSAP